MTLPKLECLKTEHEKVEYFHSHVGLSLSLLPCQIYKRGKDGTESRHYFIDRYPIYFERQNASEKPVFMYCDHGERSLLGFVSYLESYKSFLRSLCAFCLVYISATSKKCQRAQGFFTRRITCPAHIDTAHLQRYFAIRRLWQTGQTARPHACGSQLAPPSDDEYRAAFLQEIYLKWSANKLSATPLHAFVNANRKAGGQRFGAHFLLHSYDILDHISVAKNATKVEPSRRMLVPASVPLSMAVQRTAKFKGTQGQSHET